MMAAARRDLFGDDQEVPGIARCGTIPRRKGATFSRLRLGAELTINATPYHNLFRRRVGVMVFGLAVDRRGMRVGVATLIRSCSLVGPWTSRSIAALAI